MPFSISVIIPTYNRAFFIKETIESVLRQTTPVREIVVVDDGSTDCTSEVVSRIQGPIRYIRQENAGPGAARSRGIQESRGDWIAFLDSDDLWVSRKIELQMKFLEQHRDIDFLFANMVLMDEDGNEPKAEFLDNRIYRYCLEHSAHLERLFECLLRVNFIPTSSVIFRRAKLAEVGLMGDLKCAEDSEWWIRWSLLTKCGFLDDAVSLRRIHENNIIKDRALMLQSTVNALSRIQQTTRNALSRQRRALLQNAIHRHRYNLASHYFAEKRYRDAWETLLLVPPWIFHSGFSTPAKWMIKLGFSYLQLDRSNGADSRVYRKE